MPQPINFAERLTHFERRWSPHLIARLNDYELKLAKLEGEFVWHQHDDTDEAFIVLTGALCIELHEGNVELGPCELYVVPRGVQHRPVARGLCEVLLIEPRGLVNTGEAGGPLTNAVIDLTQR